MTEIEKAIRSEILTAIALLGGAPELLATLELAGKDEMYRAAERLGADRYLLASIGSWGDTLEDAEVLSDLREWTVGEAQAQRSPG